MGLKMRDGDGDGTPAGRRAVRPPAVPRVTRDDVSTRHTPSRLVARVSVTVRHAACRPPAAGSGGSGARHVRLWRLEGLQGQCRVGTLTLRDALG